MKPADQRAEAQIRTLSEKKLVGIRMTMSLAQNQTYQLWSSFMPRRREILNNRGTDLYSVQLYNADFNFIEFDPSATFEKWAAIEVVNFETVPDHMETLIIPEGLYAVFIHKGPASEGERTFRYIFGTWLPHSQYEADNRPHFEILGAKYKNNDPDSEEEVWIPIKLRKQ